MKHKNIPLRKGSGDLKQSTCDFHQELWHFDIFDQPIDFLLDVETTKPVIWPNWGFNQHRKGMAIEKHVQKLCHDFYTSTAFPGEVDSSADWCQEFGDQDLSSHIFHIHLSARFAFPPQILAGSSCTVSRHMFPGLKLRLIRVRWETDKAQA